MTNSDPEYVCAQLEKTVLDMQLHDVDSRYEQEDIDDAIDILVDLDDHHALQEEELDEVLSHAHSIIADHLYDFASQEAFASFDLPDQNAIIGAEHNGDYQLYHMSNIAFDRIDARESEEARQERLAAKDFLRAERARRRANRARDFARNSTKRAEKRAQAKRRRGEKKRDRAIKRRSALRKRAERFRKRAGFAEAKGETKMKRGERRAARFEKGAERTEKFGAFKDAYARKYADRQDKRADRYLARDKERREIMQDE